MVFYWEWGPLSVSGDMHVGKRSMHMEITDGSPMV